MDKKKYQNYINNFRRRLAPYLKPGVGLSCDIFPSSDGGAVLEFTIGETIENDDEYKSISKSLATALSNVKQRAFGGNLEGFHFSGTNTILEPNRIIYIKETNPIEWSDLAAEQDVQKLITNSQEAKK